MLLPALALASVLVSGQTGVTNGEWPHWGGDQGNTKYSPLDQINRDNVKTLRDRVAVENRQFRAASAEQHGSHAADGRRRALHACRHPAHVAAIDGATGETLGPTALMKGERGDVAPRSVSRGVEYWTDGKTGADHPDHAWLPLGVAGCEDRRARSRVRQERRGRFVRRFRSATPKDGTISSTSPAVVVRNVVITGAALGGGHGAANEGKHQRLCPRL